MTARTSARMSDVRTVDRLRRVSWCRFAVPMDGANVGANVRRSDGGSVAARFLVPVRGVDGRRERRRECQTFGRWIGCGAIRWPVRGADDGAHVGAMF